ncbi:helix-turn-helix domain-containing protein [Bacillus tropicus]|nr:helix-turn-helix domain-containing protein [Bacillus cereus]MCC2340205.1 helix-turn-helix domain-containing protein [Bacillus tropicus]MCU5595269.1 helix-turn-helix domain-containing protein [Bacillus mobilis]MCU5425390.1 helix-turn-helix domain-containing protein [Bacillus tropicus]MCU5736752.1 helix-turn-helix domain-containing protein [Bacillus mobilis]
MKTIFQLFKLVLQYFHRYIQNELREMTGISLSSITKLNNGENVTTGILICICKVLDCNITDITWSENRKIPATQF